MKDSVVHFRISKTTKAEIKNTAKKWGMSLSVYCLKKVSNESWEKTELSHLLREVYRLRGAVAKLGGLYVADISSYKGLDPRRADLKKALFSNQSCQSKINNLIDTIIQSLRNSS